MDNIYLEIFGYIGTALVIISMMMTSVLKLRIINMCGGLISLIYAVLTETWPVAVLNACLVCINFVQTMRKLKAKSTFAFAKTSLSDGALQYFISYFGNDLKEFSGVDTSVLCEDDLIYLIFSKSRLVGFTAGEKNGTEYNMKMCYIAPHNREKDITEAMSLHFKNEDIYTLKTENDTNTFIFGIGNSIKKL